MPLGLRPEYMEKYDEEPCERRNRIWHCLQHLDHYRGNAALLLSENAKLVGSDFQPRWWKKQPALSATAMLEAAMALIVPPSNCKERICSLILDLGDPEEDVDGWLDVMLEEPEYGDKAMEIRRPQRLYSPCSFPSTRKMSLLDEKGGELDKTRVVYDFKTSMDIGDMNETIDNENLHDIRFTFRLKTDTLPIEPEFELPVHLRPFMRYENGAFVSADPRQRN
jgi:hypothetical protein